MSRRAALGTILLALIVLNLAMIAVAIARYPALFAQHSALLFVLEPAGILLVYAVATVSITKARGTTWNTIRKNAIAFGLITGALEVLNIGIENNAAPTARGPALSIGFMLIVFTLWGIAGARTARSCNSTRAGIFAAVISAGVCMLIAVAAGFVTELFVVPLDPASVSTWAEFKRSGWTDAHAFGLANTLDSGFTHLIIAPIVAMVFGGIGSLFSRFVTSRVRPAT
jgi:hypothetical protein